MDAVGPVANFARSVGVTVDEPVLLRSTNNVVAWLSPSDVVAKISGHDERLRRELALGSALTALEAPIVPPHPRLGDRVYRVAGLHVSFWVHLPQGDAPDLSSDELAAGLAALHRRLAHVVDLQQVVIPSIGEEIATTLTALDDPTFAPELQPGDRALLADALVNVSLDAPADRAPVIHGSPHRFNVLSSGGRARFIDFETVSRGPVEWDLAHLEPAVAERYPRGVDDELLARCRTAVSAKTTAYCWAALDRGPDMRWHAEHHLERVQASRS